MRKGCRAMFNLSMMQHAINWWNRGGHFDDLHFKRVIEAKEADLPPRVQHLSIARTVFPETKEDITYTPQQP